MVDVHANGYMVHITLYIVDDVQAYGNVQMHDINLQEVMEYNRSAGIKLNIDKCIIKTEFFMSLVTCTF